MKYCSSCGKILDDNTLFCPVCGQRNEVKAESAGGLSEEQSYTPDESWGYTQAVMPSQYQPKPAPASQPAQQSYGQAPAPQQMQQTYGQASAPQPVQQSFGQANQPQTAQQSFGQSSEMQSYGQTLQSQLYGQAPQPQPYASAAQGPSAGQVQDPYFTLSYLNRQDQPSQAAQAYSQFSQPSPAPQPYDQPSPAPQAYDQPSPAPQPFRQPYLQNPQLSGAQGYPYGKIPAQTEPRPVPIPAASGPYFVDPSKEEKEKPNIALMVILAALFAAGMLMEILMKVSVARSAVGINAGFNSGAARALIFERFCAGFTNEAEPLYALLIFNLGAMRIRPVTAFAGLIRWFPYLILFFLPVLAALVRKKGIPLIICGGFTLLEGMILLLSRIGSRYPASYRALPFIFEGIIVILLAVAFFTKNKPMLIVSGALAAVLAILTPFISPTIFQMTVMAMPGKQFFTVMRRMTRHPRMFEYMSGSYWPIFKMFSLLMYSVLAFLSMRSLKKEK